MSANDHVLPHQPHILYKQADLSVSCHVCVVFNVLGVQTAIETCAGCFQSGFKMKIDKIILCFNCFFYEENIKTLFYENV